MQQFLKPSCRSTRTGIIPAEPFVEILLSVNDPESTLHARFGREAFPPLTGRLEKRSRLVVGTLPWEPPGWVGSRFPTCSHEHVEPKETGFPVPLLALFSLLPVVPPLSDHLFWDVDRATIDPDRHAPWLVKRVLKSHSLPTMLEWFEEKYQNSDRFIGLRSLAWFEDAELEPDPISMSGLSWDHVKMEVASMLRALE